jgi:hypothetical protein
MSKHTGSFLKMSCGVLTSNHFIGRWIFCMIVEMKPVKIDFRFRGPDIADELFVIYERSDNHVEVRMVFDNDFDTVIQILVGTVERHSAIFNKPTIIPYNKDILQSWFRDEMTKEEWSQYSRKLVFFSKQIREAESQKRKIEIQKMKLNFYKKSKKGIRCERIQKIIREEHEKIRNSK